METFQNKDVAPDYGLAIRLKCKQLVFPAELKMRWTRTSIKWGRYLDGRGIVEFERHRRLGTVRDGASNFRRLLCPARLCLGQPRPARTEQEKNGGGSHMDRTYFITSVYFANPPSSKILEEESEFQEVPL